MDLVLVEGAWVVIALLPRSSAVSDTTAGTEHMDGASAVVALAAQVAGLDLVVVAAVDLLGGTCIVVSLIDPASDLTDTFAGPMLVEGTVAIVALVALVAAGAGLDHISAVAATVDP